MTHSLRAATLCFALLFCACNNAKNGNVEGEIPDASPSDPPDGGGQLADAGSGSTADASMDAMPAADADAAAVTSDAAPGCATECAADECGAVPDGCGGFLTCDQCADGEVCGLFEPNRCGEVPSDCVPKTAAEVCGGQCGAVSDQCSDVIICDADNGGVTCSVDQVCGGFGGALQPNVCVDKPSCVTQTCATLGVECGPEGDGCGGELDCTAEHGCGDGEICGTGVASGICIPTPPPQCTALTPEVACADTCGTVGDGCESTLDCPCPGIETCGGGGIAGECGSGAMDCVPFLEEDVCAGKCGSQPDGCSGVYICSDANGGQTCNAAQGESCGGGGVPSVCGKAPCVAKTYAQACPGSGGLSSCGLVADDCGELIQCGACGSTQTCGLFSPNVCGEQPTCQPTPPMTACVGKCGTVPDGCGDSYTCNAGNGGVTCGSGEFCGANAANQCGAPVISCVPENCSQLGHACGLASDGCGHVLNCWPGCAPSNASCTGSCGEAASCVADSGSGEQSCVVGQPACSGSLCGHLPTGCSGSSPTRLTGTVRTPGRFVNSVWLNQLPVPNAIVYIPADPAVAIPSVFEGVQAGNAASCGRCEDEELVADGESLLVGAVTDYKGEFTLEGRIPVDTAFNLVIKVGKWRRVVAVPSGISEECETQPLDIAYTRLPATSVDGLSGTHLPKIAVSTGDVDAMECVLRGIGIADSEFTVPSGNGRIHMYRANGARMGSAGAPTTVADTVLYASQGAINAYDVVVFDCEGSGHYIRSASPLSRVLAYVNAGGRLFASHWSYEWLDGNGTLEQAAEWTNTGSDPTGTGFISLPSGNTLRTGANPQKSLVFRDWLAYQGALTGMTPGQLTVPSTPEMTITDPRDVAGTGATIGPSTDEWMYRNSSGPKVQQLSFNTPYGSAEDAICGRVAFSAFHVAAAAGGGTLDTSSLYFPAECNNSSLTPQEKTLAFMLFDLATCVSTGEPPAPPSCTAQTPADLCPTVNSGCNYFSDGCGGVVDCGACGAGYYCDGNTCRPQECTPATCASLGFNCGSHADSCGGIARNSQGVEGCGECSVGQACGLGGPGLCGSSGCVPIAMGTACPANSCGLVSNGCGDTWDCGACPSGVCGGAGANLCGPGSCTPTPIGAACAERNCGLVSNGCGGTYDCGQCTAPLSCGGAGTPNLCGQRSCTPYTPQQACAGLECGWVSNGCGGAINCGSCPGGGVCGGAGPNLCGQPCITRTCDDANAECGAISDHCGGIVQCGMCTGGQTCGADGPNQCGSGPTCTATTCIAAQAECGLIGNGCGGILDCGVCTVPGETCGGAGDANQCGTGTSGCNELTCGGQDVDCGAASNGCGGLLDCGGCINGYCERAMCVTIPQ